MDVQEFEWDEHNETKVRLRLEPDEVDSVLESRYLLVRNKRHRAGTHKIIGVTHGGRVVTIIIASTTSPGRWRPVNAWAADREEFAQARKAGIVK